MQTGYRVIKTTGPAVFTRVFMREMKHHTTRDVNDILDTTRVSFNIMLTDMDSYKKGYANPYYVDLDNEN